MLSENCTMIGGKAHPLRSAWHENKKASSSGCPYLIFALKVLRVVGIDTKTQARDFLYFFFNSGRDQNDTALKFPNAHAII